VNKRFTLGKNERLKSRKQIEQMFNEGKRFTVNPFRVFFIISDLSERTNLLQFGVGAGTKNFKKAVDRNKIKRLTREAWRLLNHELKDKLKASGRQLNVFFIYTGNELPDFKIVKDKVTVALKKLSDKIDENNSSNS
jgi:ribonuclease P protein component